MSTILRATFRSFSPFQRQLHSPSPPYKTKLSTIVCQKAQLRRHHGLRATCNPNLRDYIPLPNGFRSRNILSHHLPSSHNRSTPVSIYLFRCKRRFSDFRGGPTKPGNRWSRVEINVDSRRFKLTAIVFTLVALFYVYHLERVPETGRLRFIFFSKELETNVQNEQYESLIEEYKGRILPSNHPITQQVRNVVATILAANDLGTLSGSLPETLSKKDISSEEGIWDPDAGQAEMNWSSDEQPGFDTFSGRNSRRWNLIIVDDDSVVNAMVVNGNIVIFTGILPVTHDIDGLAAVLSHEIAHVVARHLSEKLSARVLFEALLTILDILGLHIGSGPLIVDFLYHLPNSRTMELEADKIGLQLASRACFDPRGAVSMQARLAKLESQHSPRINLSLLQTHPAGTKRVKLLEDALPEAYVLRAGSSACAQLEDAFDAFRSMAESVRNEQEADMGVDMGE